jgi:hypothetical protein
MEKLSLGGSRRIGYQWGMQAPDSHTPLEFYHQTKRVGMIFSLSVIALFGAMFLLGFFNRLSYLGPDEWILGIIGVALLVFDGLLYRYLTRPQLTLLESGFWENRLFGKREFRYADLVSLSAYLDKIYPKCPNGSSSIPVVVQRLVVKTRDGRERRMTLPSFGHNESVIQSLESRSGIQVVRLPDREEKWR